MESLIIVDRFDFKADWTRSNLLVKGVKDGYMVEDEIRAVKVQGETAIPYDTYELGLRDSPTMSSQFLWSDSAGILIDAGHIAKYPHITDFVPHKLIWVLNVKGFQFIYLHWGNTDDDSLGCGIVGRKLGTIQTKKGPQDGVVDSRSYYCELYAKVYPLIKAGGQTITYRKAA